MTEGGVFVRRAVGSENVYVRSKCVSVGVPQLDGSNVRVGLIAQVLEGYQGR
jgi:hypothetical protein